jgi:hypothetical protein
MISGSSGRGFLKEYGTLLWSGRQKTAIPDSTPSFFATQPLIAWGHGSPLIRASGSRSFAGDVTKKSRSRFASGMAAK